MRKYKNETTNINGNGNVPANECNCITFYNPDSNTSNLTVNSMPIKPGCILMYAGLAGEIDTTIYDVKVGSTSDIYYVIRKFYIG